MKSLIIGFTFFSLLPIVQSKAVSTEKSETFKKEAPEMRHGWSIVTGQKRTIEGVNDAQTIERGKLVFKMNCVGCHGKTGEGDGPLAKDFNIQPANLKKVANQKANYSLVIQINKGQGDMPKWQDLLTEQQIWDLSNYIQTLNKE